jgi:hypothetical protein
VLQPPLLAQHVLHWQLLLPPLLDQLLALVSLLCQVPWLLLQLE